MAYECQIIIGADKNTNLEGNMYGDNASIKVKSRGKFQMQTTKVKALEKLIRQFGWIDAYRCKKNPDNDKAGFIFCPRGITLNP